MRKTKLFTVKRPEEIEKQVNQWVEETGFTLISVSFLYHTFYGALVIYEEPTVISLKVDDESIINTMPTIERQDETIDVAAFKGVKAHTKKKRNSSGKAKSP